MKTYLFVCIVFTFAAQARGVRLRIVRAGNHQLSDIQHMLLLTWMDTHKHFFSDSDFDRFMPKWRSLDFLQEVLKNSTYYFYCALYESKIIGVIRGHRVAPDRVCLDTLYVHPDFQKRGIGTQLFKRFLRKFRRCKLIAFDVFAHVKKAMNFYDKFGCKVAEYTSKRLLENGDPLVMAHMEKRL